MSEGVGVIGPEQSAALDALEEVFGPVDPLLHNVKDSHGLKSEYGYKHWIERSLKEALIHWGQYKHALTVDWEEVERKRHEAYIKQQLERGDKVRDNVVGGAFNQLMSRARASKTVATLQYEEDGYWNLIAYGAEDVNKELFSMSYMPADMEVTVTIGQDTVITDSVSRMVGSCSPRQQLKGLDAVLTWLDEKDFLVSN